MNLLVQSSRSTVIEKPRCCRTRIPANSDSEDFPRSPGRKAEETSPTWTRSLCRAHACSNNDETSFQVSCASVGTRADIPKMTNPRFCLLVSTFGVFPREDPAHAQPPFRFEIQVPLFARGGGLASAART